jgi:hypothetical protein
MFGHGIAAGVFRLAERYRLESQQRNRQDGCSQQERRKRFRGGIDS